MHKQAVSFNPTHKLILQAQNLPTAPQGNNNFWDRVHDLKFPYKYDAKKILEITAGDELSRA